MRPSKEIVLSLVIALIAGGTAYASLDRLTKTSEVVVAARDIEPLASLDASHVKVMKLPTAAVHPNAYRTTSQVVGKRAAGPIIFGQQVLPGHLADSADDLNRMSPSASVVMFIPMPLGRWVGGAIKAGDTVDLIFCANEQRTGFSIARLIATRVPVVSHSGTGVKRWEGAANEVAGLNVLVSVEDAEKIAYCLENGTLYACLNTGASMNSGVGATLESVMGLGSLELTGSRSEPR